MNNLNESGRTMLEMLGVLAIMGIITYGAIAGINYGMSSYKINQTYSEIQDIVQGIEDLYSWSKGYPDSNALMKAACDNAIFVNPCTGTGGSLKVSGQFGEITLKQAGTDLGGSKYDNFKISISVSNQTECERLVNMDWASINIDCKLGENPCAATNCSTNNNFSFQPK